MSTSISPRLSEEVLKPSAQLDGPRSGRMGVRGRSPELLAAFALALFYAAFFAGHTDSIDSLLIYRQGSSLAFDHSIRFAQPIWWGPSYSTSISGVGLALLYIPSLFLFSWLRPLVPVQNGMTYDFGLYYNDPLYMAACAPVTIVVTAATAYMVARFLRLLGFGSRTAVLGMVLYGLASPAWAYSRSGFPQPLESLCWIVAMYAAVAYRLHGRRRAVVMCFAAAGYAMLTRPVEGALLMVALLLLILARSPRRGIRGWVGPVAAVAAAAVGALTLTLLVNWLRFGNPIETGYQEPDGTSVGWSTPLPVGLAGALVSPARGLLWSFPAIILVPFGVRRLARATDIRVVVAILVGSVLLLLNVATWKYWGGGSEWALRLFVPALPLLAVLAAAGASALPSRLPPWARRWAVPAIVAAGVLWELPCVTADLNAGYGGTASGSGPSFRLTSVPYSAWHWVKHLIAPGLDSRDAVDILWLKLAPVTRGASVFLMASLLVAAWLLAVKVRRRLGVSSAPTGQSTAA